MEMGLLEMSTGLHENALDRGQAAAKAFCALRAIVSDSALGAEFTNGIVSLESSGMDHYV
jgi:hypothetical protein